jgi:hypothetical protein
MNERIKQLAEQAGIAVWGDAVYMYHPGNTLDSTVMTKFAELIVKECMDIAHNVGNISEPDDWALDRCYEIEQKIQDRFGVKE